MFDRSEILRSAWSSYRRDVLKGWGVERNGPFSRSHFAYCLRMAWAVCKEVAAKADLPAPAPLSKPTPAPEVSRRVAAIEAEMLGQQLRDFIDWPVYRALSSELVSLQS